jgi:hypothetical protein
MAATRSRVWLPAAPPYLWLAITAEIAFLLAVPRYVTVDGAAHLAGGAVIRDILQGGADLHLRYLDLTPALVPNLLPELALGVAMLFLDPAAAEKLLQIAYVALLPLALLYAVRSVAAGRDWLALLALPFTFSFAFQFGFYDFSFGVALFLVAAGYLWRHRDGGGWRAGFILGALSFGLLLTHLVPFLELAVFAAIVYGTRLIAGWRAGGLPAARMAVGRLLPLGLALVPSAVLAGSFLLATRSAEPAEYLNLPLQVLGVLGLGLGLVTTDRSEILVAVALALSLLALFAAVVRRRLRVSAWPRETDALLAFGVAATAIACLAPDSVRSGASYIAERLALFPVFGLALWLAAVELPSWGPRLAGLAWTTAAAALLLVRLPITIGLSEAALEYEGLAGCVATASTMVQLNLSRLPSGSLSRTDPMLADAGRVAAPTHGHDLGNFEGTFPFFLYRNRADNDPYRYLLTRPDGLRVPPAVDLEGYARQPEGTVDYVFLVGRPTATSATLSDAGWLRVRDELDRGYRYVTSTPDGLVEVWERLDPALGTAGAARRALVGPTACPGRAAA